MSERAREPAGGGGPSGSNAGPAGFGIEDVWYGASPLARALRAGLSPLSALFGAGAAARAQLYDRGLLVAARAAAPVVSVGGLSVGGSGKTPFVLWLAAQLRARGLRPCIVTRGYGGAGARTAFVLDARSAAAPDAVRRAGDEAVLLALRSRTPVAVGRDRAGACELAARQLAARGQAPDVFLLDDGFQHRRLARDLDIVLVGGDEASQRLLPAGPLRESVAALSRADVVVQMGKGGGEILTIGGALHLCLRASTRPAAVVRAVTDESGEAPSVLRGRRVVAVAAIARPQRFLADLERCGAEVVARLLYRDHHVFDDEDRRRIASAAASADLVVTTEKDLVKLATAAGDARLRALRIETQVDQERALLERIAALAAFDR